MNIQLVILGLNIVIHSPGEQAIIKPVSAADKAVCRFPLTLKHLRIEIPVFLIIDNHVKN